MCSTKKARIKHKKFLNSKSTKDALFLYLYQKWSNSDIVLFYNLKLLQLISFTIEVFIDLPNQTTYWKWVNFIHFVILRSISNQLELLFQ